MVYVDGLFNTAPTKRWPFKRACHLTADTEDELHAFAQSIGLKREWFQKHPSLDHYDLTAGVRARAIRAGAKSITRSHVAHMIWARRATRKAGAV